MKEEGIINKIYDNSETNDKGVFISNFTIDLVNGTRLYCREALNPMPSSGDRIGYDVVSKKESKAGNPYTNVEKLVVLGEGDKPTPTSNQPITPTNNSNGFRPDNNKDRLIYVTGIVGRAMSSGSFSEEKIDVLTERAVASFNKHLG
tara:strand:+ start:248 stop:688 length:441 start_codon:yes stop_codon:yes gene_type:complete